MKDVYKRQGQRTQGGAIFTLADLALAAAANSHGTLAFSPVSYTHLDVYKRQDIYSRPQKLRLQGLSRSRRFSYP